MKLKFEINWSSEIGVDWASELEWETQSIASLRGLDILKLTKLVKPTKLSQPLLTFAAMELFCIPDGYQSNQNNIITWIS